ncbi:MAG: hypothetical protein PHF37_06510 [Phycisphaerae bacterium]|nr:hypothetical protein [Phycisphaerae bacterium]
MSVESEKADRRNYYGPTTELDDDELVVRIIQDLRTARGDKAQDFSRNLRYRNIYMALDDPNDIIDESTGQMSDDRGLYSNTYLPLGAAAVDTAVAQLYNHLFPTPDYFEMEAGDFMEDFRSPKITEHMKKRHREMRFRTKICQILQIICCFDYAVSFMRWQIKPGYVPVSTGGIENIEMGGISMRQRKRKTQWEYRINAVERPDLCIVPYFNCVHDANSFDDFESATFFIDWRDEPITQLMAYAENKDGFGKYKNIETVIAEHDRRLAEINEEAGIDPARRSSRLSHDRIRIYRYWTHEEMSEMAYGKIIYRSKTDGIGAQLWKLFRRPSEFPGMGILQRIERQQLDINTIINLKRDFQNRQLNPISAISEDLIGSEEGDIELYPGRTFRFRRGEAKKKIEFYYPGMDISQGATEELTIQMDSIERVTGFGSENVQGAFSSGRKTAREVSAVAAGIVSKAKYFAENIETDCLEPLYMRQFLLEQANLSQIDQFKYFGAKGSDWVIIRPEDYAFGSVPVFHAKGSSQVSYSEIQIERFFKAVQVGMSIAPQLHNWPNIIAKMWQMLEPKDFRHFIKDPREKTHNVPPRMENVLLAMGHEVEISPENDDREHLAEHRSYQKTGDYQLWPEAMKRNMENHCMEHEGRQNLSQMALSGGMQNLANSQDMSDPLRGIRQLSVG